MQIKTPEFWRKRNLISFALLPLSLLYFIGYSLVNFFTKTTKISKKVICVGNLIAGGSGKTPTAIALGKILNEIILEKKIANNFAFAYLSRGYMGDGSKFLLLSKDGGLRADQVGDEPLLLIDTAPTFVAQNRLFGAKQIEIIKKFQLIILDDGMQNNSLYRDFIILVIDGNIGFGNEFLIPAGPMRESVKQGLKKADLIVLIGEASEKLLKKLEGKKIAKAKISVVNLQQFLEKKLLAFCGLAYPQKFFSLLKKEGLEVLDTYSFADHYSYKISDLKDLVKIAAEKNLQLITTKKDWIKFPKNFQEKIPYLDIELEFENKDLIKSELRKIYEF